MSPNEQAITLLAGFASGNAKMKGDSVKHIPTIPEGFITQTLNEIWGTLKWKKDTSGSAIHTKKAKVAQKEPKKTIARQLAKRELCTKIPDSEIRLENIILGSPTFVPCKCIKPKGKGKGVKDIKINNISVNNSDSEMARSKCTKTKVEIEKENAKRARTKCRASCAKQCSVPPKRFLLHVRLTLLQTRHPISSLLLMLHVKQHP